MGYDARRNHLLKRLRQQLAEPVADLLAIAYEPRVDTEQHVDYSFDTSVTRKQSELREAIRGLTTRDGGRVEIIAKTVAKELIYEAETAGLTRATEQLKTALERCTQIGAPGQTGEQRKPEKLPDIERVIGRSGKPIGLWR